MTSEDTRLRRTSRIEIRCTAAQAEAYQETARTLGLPPTEWIRRALDAAVADHNAAVEKANRQRR